MSCNQSEISSTRKLPCFFLNAPVLCNTNIDVYINFVDSVVKEYVPAANKNLELFKLACGGVTNS